MFGVRQRSARGPGSGRGRVRRLGVGVTVLAISMFGLAVPAGASNGGFISPFTSVSTVASTVPANGDVNPYGIVVVPRTIGGLTAGHVLVSNFNASSNEQGTGTTIVDIAPDGTQRLFAQINPNALRGPCPGGVGLTTALTVLPGGWVVVGSLPTTDGSAATAKAGCLIVLDSRGHVVETWASPLINGPWDLTSVPTPFGAVLFVTNVLNGTVAANGATVNRGTVVRIWVDVDPGRLPRASFMSVVANGFPERTDPAALVVGPTGVALGAERDAVRRRHGDQPRRGSTGRIVPVLPVARWRDGFEERGAECAARADARAERRHPHREWGGWEPRRDDAVGSPGGRQAARQQRRPAGCRSALRPRRRPAWTGSPLRRRRDEHAEPLQVGQRRSGDAPRGCIPRRHARLLDVDDSPARIGSELRTAYLHRLGLDAEPPSVEALQQLHRRHVERVPYETMWLHAGEQWGIDPVDSVSRIAWAASRRVLLPPQRSVRRAAAIARLRRGPPRRRGARPRWARRAIGGQPPRAHREWAAVGRQPVRRLVRRRGTR